jgi:hypothetical protein
MAVRKVFYRTEIGTPVVADVIEYRNGFWLVPYWIEEPSTGTWRPARIISLSGLKTENPAPQYKDVDWALTDPLHMDILDGRQPSQDPLVIPQPDIFLTEADFHR